MRKIKLTWVTILSVLASIYCFARQGDTQGLEFYPPLDFCTQASYSGLICLPQDLDLAGRLTLRIDRIHPVDEPESVKAGLALYLTDRRLRRKPLNSEEMNGIFAEVFHKRGPVYLPHNQVQKKDVKFFTRILNHPSFHLRGEVIHSSSFPFGSPVVEIANETGIYYFKDIHHLYDPPVVGKKLSAEVSAYLLSRLMGFDLVPETHIGVLGHVKRVGSVQRAVPSSYRQGSRINYLHKILMDPGFQDAVEALSVFDYLSGVGDRRAEHLFLNFSNFKIKVIDHETAFHMPVPPIPSTEDFYSGGRLPVGYSAAVRVKIFQLSLKDLRQTFQFLLTEDQIEAIWLRAQILKADLIRKYGKLLP